MLRLLAAVALSVLLLDTASAQTVDAFVPPFATVEAVRASASGGQTASGEYYNPERLTMAHPDLPMGTLVDVTFRRRTVTVRVNDRPPAGSTVRLSARAADQLGLPPGGAEVELRLDAAELAHIERRREKIQSAEAPPMRLTTSSAATYSVQIGAFSERDRAMQRAAQLNGAYVEQGWSAGSVVYRVLYGRYSDADRAAAARDWLRARGIDGFVQAIATGN